MFVAGKHRVSLLEHLSKKIARNYLNKNSKTYLKNYDQLATLSFDYISREVLLNGVYELKELNLLKETFGDYLTNKAVVDIGANIGNHTVFFAKISESVYSFEPNEIIFQLLKFNTRDYKNINIFNYGCSDADSKFTAVIPKNNWGCGRISSIPASSDDLDKGTINLTFKVKPLDSLEILKDAQIGLIKIDVEGHELSALNGMKNTIQKNKPVLVFEQNQGIYDGTSKEIEFLKSLGYKKIYVMESYESWLTPNFIPNPIKKLLRFIEIILIGHPDKLLKLVSKERLDKLSYRMIVMTF